VDVIDGNSCHYECVVGYRLSGSPMMTCESSSAQWLGQEPTCTSEYFLSTFCDHIKAEGIN